MNKKEKEEKKRIISRNVNLENGRYKDEEIDELYELVTNFEEHNGLTKSIKNEYTGWSSDGKYTREEETAFTIKEDSGVIQIEEVYKYHDDDGQSGSRKLVHNSGRDIITVLKSIFKD